MRRIPHGLLTEARKSDAKVTGLSQRRVRAGLMILLERMATPSLERSVADAYMLPPLRNRSVCVANFVFEDRLTALLDQD